MERHNSRAVLALAADRSRSSRAIDRRWVLRAAAVPLCPSDGGGPLEKGRAFPSAAPLLSRKRAKKTHTGLGPTWPRQSLSREIKTEVEGYMIEAESIAVRVIQLSILALVLIAQPIPAAANGWVLFLGEKTGNARGLWRTDGTPEGFSEITIKAGMSLEVPRGAPPFASIDQKVMFVGRTVGREFGLWLTDGTSAEFWRMTFNLRMVLRSVVLVLFTASCSSAAKIRPPQLDFGKQMEHRTAQANSRSRREALLGRPPILLL